MADKPSLTQPSPLFACPKCEGKGGVGTFGSASVGDFFYKGPCPFCKGAKNFSSGTSTKCVKCHGSGSGGLFGAYNCNLCAGEGYFLGNWTFHVCTTCTGKGGHDAFGIPVPQGGKGFAFICPACDGKCYHRYKPGSQVPVGMAPVQPAPPNYVYQQAPTIVYGSPNVAYSPPNVPIPQMAPPEPVASAPLAETDAPVGLSQINVPTPTPSPTPSAAAPQQGNVVSPSPAPRVVYAPPPAPNVVYAQPPNVVYANQAPNVVYASPNVVYGSPNVVYANGASQVVYAAPPGPVIDGTAALYGLAGLAGALGRPCCPGGYCHHYHGGHYYHPHHYHPRHHFHHHRH